MVALNEFEREELLQIFAKYDFIKKAFAKIMTIEYNCKKPETSDKLLIMKIEEFLQSSAYNLANLVLIFGKNNEHSVYLIFNCIITHGRWLKPMFDSSFVVIVERFYK